MKDICQNCKKKPAVFYYEQIINGKKSNCALCAECAAEWRNSHKKQEESYFQMTDISPFSGIDALFGSLFAPSGIAYHESKRCPLCHASFADLKRSGKAGCAVCYETFEDELAPTVRSIHGAQKHTGRTPASFANENKKEKRLEELREALKREVDAQAYEDAVKLRDEIRALENE